MKISFVTQHAIDRAVERFGVKRQLAESWIRTNLNKAKFIADIVESNGRDGRLFVNEGIAFIIEKADTRVITVYKPNVPAALYDKVATIVQRELAKSERQERSIERRNTLIKAELRIELAELNLRLLRARSQATKNAVTGRIRAVELRIAELDAEIDEVRRNKSKVARGVAAYL